MNYADLVQFDPIESVVELRSADAADAAKRLVETFVISDRMAELLQTVIFPQLQFSTPADNKGLWVVGNYGTGKSHIMALISAIAERAELADCLENKEVAKAASETGGRFQVIRAEAPSTQMALRDLICQRIERWLADHDIDYTFPSYGDVKSNKDDTHEMMAAFEQKFPEQGLLFVLDELLDYLRSRNHQEVGLDLGFLRELGEVCNSSRFRFIAGVQESLFDNPRFQFIADTLKRVNQRFEQLLIVREDVAYVVSRRLLRKTADQESRIREHLGKFTKLYGSMNERLDDFVRLFPVHPAYLAAFERVTVAEKREILKTLSRSMKKIIDDSVPEDEPGLIAYDSYWAEIRENPTLRSDPTVRDVIDKSRVLADRIEHAFPRPQRKPVAMRAINGLSVHRLTTGDIHAPLGATAEELRDDLCLHVPGLPEEDSDFLRTVIESVLKDTMKTVNGQFLSVNSENGQYYIDLKKDIDFDSLIEKRGETLSEDQLDMYYFDALAGVMEKRIDDTYVAGYKIWEHEVEWRDRKAGRSGYLFFGAPNERSTAQPPRDFYLYFIQPFNTPSFTDEKKPDEVFFRLKKMDEQFEQTIRLYGGAREQASSASGKNKDIYESKARDYLRDLTKWLRENMQAGFQVSCQGKSSTLAEIVRGKIPPGGGASVSDIVNTAGSILLEPHFADLAPEYPSFSLLITKDNREQATQDALKIIGGAGVKSKNGMAVLDALELLDGDRIRPADSKFARQVLDELGKKPANQVLNRSELIRDEGGIDYWGRFRVEPEFLIVVLATLVHSGDIVLSVPGKKIDASAIEQFGKLSVDDLVNFKHIERPKDLPVGAIKELFNLLEIPEGLIVDPNNREAAVQRLQVVVAERVSSLVAAQTKLSAGLSFWGQPLLSEVEAKERAKLTAAKSFLEGLQAFNTPGKLKNFPHSEADIKQQAANLEALQEVQELVKLVSDIGPQTAYLETAEAVLPSEHPWREDVRDARTDALKKATSPKHRSSASFQRDLSRTLAELKAKYKSEYIKLFQRCRLTQAGDKRKGKLTKDHRLAQLRKLKGVEMMPAQQLDDFENRLHGLKSDWTITEGDLESSPTHKDFRPSDELERFRNHSADEQVEHLAEKLDELIESWTRVLQENLSDPTVKDKVGLISSKPGRDAVESFIKSGELPETIENTFVKALQEVLSGLERVGVTSAAITGALTKGGMPCTPDQLEQRFEAYVKALTKGKDAKKLRIVIE